MPSRLILPNASGASSRPPLASMAVAALLASLALSAPAVAKGPSVGLVAEAGTVPAGAPASAWFRAAKGSSCHLVGKHIRSRVSGRTVRVHKPLLQYQWKVPARARTGTWRLTLICAKAHRVGKATTKLEVQGGATRHASGAFRRGMRPGQASLTTSGSGLGAGSLPPYGTVLVPGTEWLGGAGVDVMSNGLIGCYNACNNRTPYGIAYQCVELVEHLVMSKGWSPRIAGDAHRIYDNASAEFFDKHPNGTGYVPVPGDIIVWHGGYGGYGHVAVVEWVADGRIGWVEQNNSASGRGSGVLGAGQTLGSNGRLVPTGILHAKANGAPPPPPPPPPLPPPPPPPPPPVGPPPPVRGYHIQDDYFLGTWARTDPDSGTWYSKANKPPNGVYWYPNGLGIGVDCGRTAANYVVRFGDGHTETWNSWFHVTDGKWYPSAATTEIFTNGLHGLPTC